MRLRDLDGSFVGRAVIVDGDVKEYELVATLAEAQGVRFLCPKCHAALGGAVGCHAVLCWFEDRGIPDTAKPKPGRWNPVGSGLDDLTFVPGRKSNSVLITEGCLWHGFVTNGEAS